MSVSVTGVGAQLKRIMFPEPPISKPAVTPVIGAPPYSVRSTPIHLATLPVHRLGLCERVPVSFCQPKSCQVLALTPRNE